MTVYFVNRLDVDQAASDIHDVIRVAGAYSGFIRTHWETALQSERRADDLKLMSYAFESGDQYLVYDMAHLTPPEGNRLGDAVDRV